MRDNPGAASRGLDDDAARLDDGSKGSASLGSYPAPPSSRLLEIMDRAAAWMLHVQPQQDSARPARRPFETSLLFAGMRCTARYIVLPFALPLLGVTTGAAFGIVTGAALGIVLILDVIAAISIVTTLRWLWRVQQARRWQYLPVALALAVLVGFFFVNDARVYV